MAADIDEIIQRLNELWAWKLGVEANSKNISQLPPATDGNKLVAAYNETSFDTEQFSISEALAQFNAQNDRLTNLGAITRVDNEFTFEVGFEGIINGLTYGNTVAIPREINVATDTFFRIDIAVLDNSNNIVIIEGNESEVIGNQPPTPPNTLLICSFSIFGSVIGNPNTINNDARIVKIIETTEIYPIVQSDSLKFLVLRSDFDVQLPLLLQDNSLFVIKNDSGFSREITFDTDIEFLGSPIIPDGALCFLKKIETTPLGVEIYSVDSISGGASLNLQQVSDNGSTTINTLELLDAGIYSRDPAGYESRFIGFQNNINSESGTLSIGHFNGFQVDIIADNLTADRLQKKPDKDGVYALTSDITTNLMLFPTTANSDIATYKKLVTNTADADYDDTAVDVSTGALTTTDVLISSLASEAGLLSGNPGTFEVSVTGNIRRTSGTANGTFYFEVYHRDSGGMETLICTSDVTAEVSSATYVEFSAKAVWNNGDFSTTDRIVYKFYGNKAGAGSNPTFDFQFGGTTPIRSTVPVAATLLLAPIYEALGNKQDILTEDNFGAFTNSLTNEDAIVDADIWNYRDSSDSGKQKKTLWSNIKSVLKTYFDTLYEKTIYKNTTPTTAVTSTTSETILESILVNGGKCQIGDMLEMWTRTTKTGTAGIATIRFRVNTTNSLSGAVLIGTTPYAVSGTLSQEAYRFLSFRTGNILATFPGATTATYGNVSSPTTETTTSLNPASDFYLLITIQLASASDSVVASSSFIRKI